MKSIARQIIAGVVLCLLLVPAIAAGSRKCSSPPGECEREIRAMLEGKPGPLGFVVRSASGGRGIVVKAVTPESAADKAGLEPGDRLMSFGGHDLSKATHAELRKTREKMMSEGNEEPGPRKIVITVNRVGTFKRLTLRIAKMTDEQIDQIVAAHLREAHGVELPPQRANSGTDEP